MPLPSRTWPFVGRAAELQSVLDAIAEPSCGGVVLVGEGGVGKTRLADAALTGVAAAGSDTVRVIASPAMRLVPLGALAQVLPPAVVDEVGDQLDAVRLFDAVREAIRRAPSGDRVVALVDDLPLLDDASLTLLGQLLGAGLVVVVGTARHGAPFSATLASLERAHRLRRVELGGLDRDAVALLLERVLGGPVEPATAGRLWQVSGGNALYLRELVLGASNRARWPPTRPACGGPQPRSPRPSGWWRWSASAWPASKALLATSSSCSPSPSRSPSTTSSAPGCWTPPPSWKRRAR